MSEGGGGGADVSSMTTPSTIVIEETDGRLRAGGDDIANLAVLVLWLARRVGHEPPLTLGRHTAVAFRNRQESVLATAKESLTLLNLGVRVCSQNIAAIATHQRRPSGWVTLGW